MQALNYQQSAHAPTRKDYQRDMEEAHRQESFEQSVRRECSRFSAFKGAVCDLYNGRLAVVSPQLARTLRRLRLDKDRERVECAYEIVTSE